MNLRGLSEHEAWDDYAYNLKVLGDRMPQFMRDGANFRLDARDAAFYDEIRDLEWLLGIGH